jgi:pimeloyl-ACP methyl ester carboxylesterase
MKHLTAQTKGHVLLAIVLSFLFIPSSLAEDSFFDSDGTKIHYVVEGKGEPLLVIHGFAGSIQPMTDAFKNLSNNFQVIAMDCRGHGQSEKPHDLDAYGMNMIKDQIRLLDHLKRAHVFGYSLGGAIAMGVVGFYPERVLSAIVGGAGWVPPGQVREITGLNWNDFADSLEQGKGIAPLLLAQIPGGQPKPTPEQLEMVNKAFMATQDPLALAAIIRNFVPSPSEAQIRSNKIPVLALIGEKDFGKKDVDRLNGLMPNLKIVVIPNASHGTAPADPLFIKSLNDFLLENSSSKSGK